MEKQETTQQSKRRGKKLFYILERLTLPEREELSLWLGSPLHGNSEKLVAMLGVTLEAMQQTESPVLTAEMFDTILSPHRELDAKKEHYVWVRVTQLQDAVRDYIIWSRFRRETSIQQGLLLQEISDRGWKRLIPEAYADALKVLPCPEQALRFAGELTAESVYGSYLAAFATPAPDKHFHQINRALDNFFLLQKLKFACGGVLEGELAADPLRSAMMAAVLAVAISQEETLPKVTAAYLKAFQMLTALRSDISKANLHFEEFLILFDNPVVFAPDDAWDLFVHGQNYCMTRYRAGEVGIVQHLIGLYDKALVTSLGLENGLMPVPFYKNTVELMCRLQKFDWVVAFIEDYRSRIVGDPEMKSYAYNLAVLRFHQQQFRQVAHLLYNILGELDKMQLGTGARLYICQSLWEIGEFEWLQSVLRAFAQHLRRHPELNSDLRVRYRRFVAYLQRACGVVTGNPQQVENKLRKLSAEVEASVSAIHLVWLRLKLKEAMSTFAHSC
jgi:hypothetical protein